MICGMRTLGIALLLCCCLRVSASAQPDKSQLDQANALLLEGRDLLARHDTAAACEKFEASIALDPTAPGVMLNLGLCYELLEKYATSLYWFRKAQAAAAEAQLPAYETEAKRHTIDLAAKVPTVRIDAAAAPEAEVEIDGKPVASTDFERVEIDRGPHKLEARATGKHAYETSFEISGRDGGTITIPTLTGEGAASSSTTTIGPDEPHGDGAAAGEPSRMPRLILGASFGVVGLGLCVASPIWASHTKSVYDTAVANGEMPSVSAARNRQHIATGMFIGGLGLIGFSTYLLLTQPAHKSTTTAIAPLLGDHQLGVAISGSL